MGATTETSAPEANLLRLTAQAGPVCELIFQLSVGPTPRSWAIACRRSLASLREDLQRAGLTRVVEAAEWLDVALRTAIAAHESYMADLTALEIREAYAELSQCLPEVFAPESRGAPRGRLLFESALLRAPGMCRRTLVKLYEAELRSFEQLRQATASELVARARIDRDLALSLLVRVQDFDRERETRDRGDLQAQAERRLRMLRARLQALNGAFDQAERNGLRELRRAARRALDAALLELNQLLAELGALDLADQLQGQSERGKLAALERYLKPISPNAV